MDERDESDERDEMHAGGVTLCPAGFGYSDENNNFTWWKGGSGKRGERNGFSVRVQVGYRSKGRWRGGGDD